MSFKLGIDIDGCLADFTHGYYTTLKEVSGRDLIDLKTDPKYLLDPPTWFWERDAGYTAEEEERAWECIKDDPVWWYSLDPLVGAKPALEMLNEMANGDFDVYFLTHRMGRRAKSQTEAWLFDHEMDVPTVLLVEDKISVVKGLELDFFIDDKPGTLVKAVMGAPDTTALYTVAYRYNQQPDLSPRVTRVHSVVEALEDFCDTH